MLSDKNLEAFEISMGVRACEKRVSGKQSKVKNGTWSNGAPKTIVYTMSYFFNLIESHLITVIRF